MIRVAPIGPGEERDFHRIYRGHPGVGRFFRTSRAALTLAVSRSSSLPRGPAPRAYLLARDDGVPAAAIALESQPGRRVTCYFPIAKGPRRPELLASLGNACRNFAREAGAVLLESEFSLSRAAAKYEHGLWVMGLERITDRRVMQRRLTRKDGLDARPVIEVEGREALDLLKTIYPSSADPALTGIEAEDDWALFGDSSRAVTVDGCRRGVCFLRQRGSIGEIVFVGVRPEDRRRGVGRSLLRAVFAELARSGARSVRLAVSEENQPALSLYSELGFREIGRARLYRVAV